MTRTKNRTGKPAAATSAAHATPPASPHPGTGPAAGGALEAVRAALAASNGDGATTATIATTAGVSRAAASKALTTLETGGKARREKGTGRGAPDTWHPAGTAGPGSQTAATQPGPGNTPDEPAQPATPPPDTASAPAATTTAEAGNAASDPAAPPASDPASPPADGGPATPPPPDPAVLTVLTENASQITVAATAVTTAVAAGDLGAARSAIEEIRDQAAAALRAVKAAAGGSRSSGTAARPGQLRELVAAHLAARPEEEFTPHEIGKVIERSSGAVANALDRLTELGQATLSCEKPRRYRHAGPAAAPGTSPAPATPDDEPAAGAA
jgi:predicted transcriptional regulator